MSDHQTTDDPEAMIAAGDASLALVSIEPGTLERLVDALGSLRDAQLATDCGLASDHMENAAREVRKAMRMVGG